MIRQEKFLNEEVIALNQDPEGRQAYSMEQWNNSDVVYVKPMSDGSYGIGFNMGDAPVKVPQFWDIGLTSSVDMPWLDLWEHEDVEYFRTYCKLEAHHCKASSKVGKKIMEIIVRFVIKN